MKTGKSDRTRWSGLRLAALVAIVACLFQILTTPYAQGGDPRPWFYGAQRLGSWSELEPLVPGPFVEFGSGSSAINLSDARSFQETWIVPRYWRGRAVVVNIYTDVLSNGKTIYQELMSRATVTDNTVRDLMHDIYYSRYPHGTAIGQIHESTMTADGWLFITDGQPVSGPTRSGHTFRGAHYGPHNSGGSTQISRMVNELKAQGVGNCFMAGTPVAMANGLEQPIERVTAGSEVLAFDETSLRVLPARVARTFVHENEGPIAVVNGRIRSTAEHPYYVHGRWVAASDLKAGDELLALEAGRDQPTMEAVDDVALSGGGQLVYNFEVEGFHDYFAGGVLVHNQSSLRGQGPGITAGARAAAGEAAEEARAVSAEARATGALAEEAGGVGERAFKYVGRAGMAWGVYQTGSHLAAGETREAAESAIGLHPELGLMLGAEQITAHAMRTAYDRMYPKKTEAEREMDKVIISDEEKAALYGMGPEAAQRVLQIRAAAEERKRLEKEKDLDEHVRGKARWVSPFSKRAKWGTFVNPLTGNRWF